MVNVNLTQLKESVGECKSQLMEIINGMSKRIELLESENKAQKSEIESLKSKNVELEKVIEKKFKECVEEVQSENRSGLANNVKSWATVAKSGVKQPVEQLIVVNAAINEAKDRERRKKNVLVFGLNESTQVIEVEKQVDDKKRVENIIRQTGASATVTFIKRFKSKTERPGPVLVGLSEAADRNPLLLKAKNLRNIEEFKNIYIAPDLTDAERMEDRNLRKRRDELNQQRAKGEPFRYAIRGNQIVKFRMQQSESSGSIPNNQ
jgi:hypothetical protein